LPVRGARLPATFIATSLVTAAIVATTVLAPAFVAAAAEFALVSISALISALVFVPVPALAFKTLARRTALVLARLAGRCAVGGYRYWRAFDRRIGTGFSKLMIAIAAAAPVPLVLWRLAGFAGGSDSGRRRTLLRAVVMAMTGAIVTRPAFFRTAARPPDLYQFRDRGYLSRGCFGRNNGGGNVRDGSVRGGSLHGSSVRRRGTADCGDLRRCL
jgi:hypothetical protein